MDFPEEWYRGIPAFPEKYGPRQPIVDEEDVLTLDDLQPGDLILAVDYFRRDNASRPKKQGERAKTAYWARVFEKRPVGATLVVLRLRLASGEFHEWPVHDDITWFVKKRAVPEQ